MPAPITTRFVLVRSTNSLNMGAVARAMMNFGLSDLAVVSPLEQRWREAHSAIYGSELLAKAKLTTLEDAISDCNIVVGTASAHNRALKRTMLTLPTFKTWLRRRLPKGGRVAIVFGSERSGLDNEEFSHCHATLRIPTEDDAPSMNLGQAAALIAYECKRAGLERSVKEIDDDMLEGEQIAGLVDAAMKAMAATGVNAHMPENVRREKVRRGLMRWRMTRGDASWLQAVLKKLTPPRN